MDRQVSEVLRELLAKHATCNANACRHRPTDIDGCIRAHQMRHLGVPALLADMERMEGAVKVAEEFIHLMQAGSYHVAADAAWDAFRRALEVSGE